MLALVLLAGCGGSGDGEASPKTSEPTDPATPALAEGEPAADALKDFVCRADDKDVWSATGSVKNSGKVATGYQVAVLVAGEDAGNAKTADIEKIQPDESASFELKELPATGEHPRCRVSVIRLDP